MKPGMEHIAAYIRPPWWKLPAITKILESKEEAKEAHRERLLQILAQDLIIYMNGLGHDTHIGAAIHSSTARIIKDHISVQMTPAASTQRD